MAELQEFRAEVTDNGYWKFVARSGKHYDLVLALAIACWRAYGSDGQGLGLLEYTRQRANGGGGWPTSAAPEPVSVCA